MTSDRGAATRGPARRRRLPELALLAGSALLALGAAECAVRAFEIGPEFGIVLTDVFEPARDPRLVYRLRPGAPDGPDRISAAGLRDRDFDPTPPAGRFRIVVGGDSVAYGMGVAASESFPKQLERLLGGAGSGRGPVFEVLNLGVPGYNATQVVQRLQGLGHGFRPALVVYAYVLNDPQAYSFEGEALRALEGRAERRLRDSVERSAGRLLARSRLFLLAWHAVGRRGAPPERYDVVEGQVLDAQGARIGIEAGVDPGHRAFFELQDRRGDYFRRLHASAEGRGRLEAALAELERTAAQAPAALVVFPVFARPRTGPYPLADVHEGVLETARSRGLAAFDLAPVFVRAAKRVGANAAVQDFVHPSAFGHLVAAHAVARWLIREGLVPTAQLDAARLDALTRADPRLARIFAAPP